jgi:hypothetical protein
MKWEYVYDAGDTTDIFGILMDKSVGKAQL